MDGRDPRKSPRARRERLSLDAKKGVRCWAHPTFCEECSLQSGVDPGLRRDDVGGDQLPRYGLKSTPKRPPRKHLVPRLTDKTMHEEELTDWPDKGLKGLYGLLRDGALVVQ